jgi:hypothetical protein
MAAFLKNVAQGYLTAPEKALEADKLNAQLIDEPVALV